MTVDGDDLDLDSGHTTGTYETPELDCLVAVRSLVACLVSAAQIDLSLTWADATWTWGSTTAEETTWSGSGTNHLTVSVEFRYGNTSGSLGSYQTFVPGQYSARYFQFKVTVTVDSPAYSATIERMLRRSTYRNYVISGKNVALTTGLVTITWTAYGPGFNHSAQGRRGGLGRGRRGHDRDLFGNGHGHAGQVLERRGANVAGAMNFLAQGY